MREQKLRKSGANKGTDYGRESALPMEEVEEMKLTEFHQFLMSVNTRL
jgi:hypothetical protein